MDNASVSEDEHGDNRLGELWKQVVKEFETATGERLAEPTTLETHNMERKLAEICESDKHEIFKKSAESICKVARYATSAAPSVFSQASMVFDALSAIQDTVQRYRWNFTPKRVLEQLRKVNEEFGHIAVYMTPYENGVELDNALQTSIIQQLTQILYLYTIYENVKKSSRSPSGIAKNILKAAIGSDGGIASRLQDIKDIKARELSDNVTALRVSDLNTSHRNLRESNLKNLQEYLTLGSQERSWIAKQDILKGRHIDRMGEWLHEQQRVHSWLDMEHQTDTPVLLLSAEAGCGKSHLCSQIVRVLSDRRKTENRMSSTAVAWVFVQGRQQALKTSDRGGKDSKQTARKHFPFGEALKALIWQLAESDMLFQNFAVKELRKHPLGFTDAMEFWDKIVMGFFNSSRSESAKPQKIFFLVLDGYYDNKTEETSKNVSMQRILQDVASLRKRSSQIRILLSGSADFSLKNSSKIEFLKEDKRCDAELFVRSHLKKSYELWDEESEEHRILWEIQKELGANFDGNYHNLMASLQEIVRLSERGPSYLRDFQGEGLTNSEKIIHRKLEMLSLDLESDDFEVLNQLMACVVHWKVWPTTQQANDYLFLRLGKEYKPPIEPQIAQKFGRLVFIDEYDNTIRIPAQHLEFLEETNDAIIYPGNDGEIPLPPQHQTHGDTVEVPRILLAHFLFHRSSSDAISTALRRWVEGNTFFRPQIRFDPIESKVDMIVFLLQIICDEQYRDRAESRCVGEYTAIWLPRHFFDVPKDRIQDVPASKRKEIGKYLWKFFMNEQIVESWMPRGDIDDYLSYGWKDGIHHVLLWLKNGSVQEGFYQQSGIETEEKSTMEREAQEGSPEKEIDNKDTGSSSRHGPASRASLQDQCRMSESAEASSNRSGTPQITRPQGSPPLTWNKLLDASFKVIAAQWLQQYRWDAYKALKFLLQVSQREDETISVEIVEEMERWAMALLNIPKAQSRRNPTHDVRLAETFLSLSDHKGYIKSEQRCELVQIRDPFNVKAVLNLSHVLERRSRMKLALDELMKIRTNIQSATFRKRDPSTWKYELERFWSLCSSTGSAREAFHACKDLADEFPEELFPLEFAFSWITRDETLDENFEILFTKRKNDGHSILAALFRKHAHSEEFHRKFYRAPKEYQLLISSTYEDAITTATSQIDKAHLQYYHGFALFHRGDATEALRRWESSVDAMQKEQKNTEEPQSTFKMISLVAERIGSTYLKMILAGKLAETDEVYISKLEQYTTWMDENYPYEINSVALLLGRIYKIQGHTSRAVSSVEKHLIKALSILDNDRDDDDWKGFFMLAEAFTILEDDDNALAAWSLIVNAPDSDRARGLSITCAGQCGWTWAGSTKLEKDLYICRDCPHVKFERGCHEHLQKNIIKHDTCWRHHGFLSIPRRKRAEVRAIEFKKVLVGKAEVEYQSWLDSLRQQYGIRHSDLPWPRRTKETFHITKWKCQRAIEANMKAASGKRPNGKRPIGRSNKQ